MQPAFLGADSDSVGFGAFNLDGELQIPGVIHHDFIDFAPGSIERLAAAVTVAASDRRVTLISWEPHVYGQPAGAEEVLAEVAAGGWDDYLSEAAGELRDTDQTVLLRFAHEMDQETSQLHPWAGQEPALYIEAWRHVHRIFEEEGAKNVEWVWTPVGRVVDDRFVSDQWYPGDRWTDMVGFTAYSFWQWEESNAEHAVRSPADLILPRYRALAKHDKPVIIPEFGVDHHPTRQQDEVPWLKEFVDLVQTQMPDLVAVPYFFAPHDASGGQPDWRLEPAQQEAFHAQLADASRFELRVP